MASDTGSSFPIRVASIDVGSNAIRFKAAEFSDADHYRELSYRRVPVRLGHLAFRTRELTPEACAAALTALAAFREQLDAHDISLYRAVATSAVRESRNGNDLVQDIRRETGLRLETISGSEEARLVWRAVRSRVDLGEHRWLIVDLGGGSVEVSLVTESGIGWTESHTMGSVRLLEELGEETDAPAVFRKLVSEYVSTMSFPDMVDGAPAAGLIATGGNIEALAKMAESPVDARGVARLGIGDLRAAIDRLASLTVEQRIEQLGFRPDRADVILPASIVYERVATLAGVDEILVPNVGVKDGVLFDLVEGCVDPSVHRSRRDIEIEAAAAAMGRRFRFHERHARQVTRLALRLFDDLDELHELDDADRSLLLAAAMLHDIGQFVSYRKHHRHSYYLIRHSELPAFSPDQVLLVALVARYHRRARPADGHEGWDELDGESRERVRRLASLLRVADALDREHLSLVESVDARVRGDRVELRVEGSGELALEKWALEKKAQLFEEVFELDVVLKR